MNEILPCPFCGSSDVEIVLLDEYSQIHVLCIACDACGPGASWYGSSEKPGAELKARDLWNTRKEQYRET